MPTQQDSFAWQPEVEGIRARWRDRATAATFLQALEEGAVTLMFQPVCRASTGSRDILYHQVQMRWQMDGPMDPERQHPYAASRRALQRLGHGPWFDMALLGAVLDVLDQYPAVSLGVGIDAQTLESDAGWPHLFSRLESHPGLAGRLVLQITGAADVKDRLSALSVVRTVRRLGCQIEIEGMGGSASLLFARDCGPQWIRLDAALVQAAVQPPDTDRAWFADVVRVCRHLGDWVVADGVTTQDLFTMVTAAGVHAVQGDFAGDALASPAWLKGPVVLQARHPFADFVSAQEPRLD